MSNTLFLARIIVVLIEGSLICIGNAFTIFVFWNQKQSLKRAYYLLLNLALADFLVGATEMIVIVTETIPRRNLSLLTEVWHLPLQPLYQTSQCLLWQ